MLLDSLNALDDWGLLVTEFRDNQALALIERDRKHSYSQLYDLIDEWRAFLRRHSHIRTCVFQLPPSAEVIGLLFAALLEKRAFVPLPLQYPEAQIGPICRELDTEGHITISEGERCFRKLTAAENAKVLSGVAYIYYTSGSTGTPKGVKISYTALCSFLVNIAKAISRPQNARYLWLSDISFDVSLLEIFIPLLTRNSVYIANTQERRHPRLLNSVLAEQQINVLQVTPSQFELLSRSGFYEKASDSLEMVLLGGEQLRKAHVAELLAKSKARVYNVYGPTEATIWCACKQVTAADDLSIGRGFGNNRLEIMHDGRFLDPANESDVQGELLISGDQLFEGYVDEALTQLAVYQQGGLRYYRTGDVASYNNEGSISIAGRLDNQVKINGVRVELEEIEHILYSRFNRMFVAAVDLQDNEPQLNIIYDGSPHLDQGAVREVIMDRFTIGVCPRAFYNLDPIPLNKNGKIDRDEVNDWYRKQL